MKKETIKELGKFILDLSKIFIAVSIIAPFVKGIEITIVSLIAPTIAATFGLYIINKGNENG